MQALFDEMRRASLPAVWSQGVKLARADAVSNAARSESSITLRVKARGHAVAPTVTLYPEEREWSCDCGGAADPCMHAVAAVIATREGTAQEAGADAAKSAPPARLVYRLGTRGKTLTLARFVVRANGEEQAVTGLASLIATGALPAGVTPTHDDLTLDRLLASFRRDVLPLARLPGLLASLASAEHVTLDGAPVKTSGDVLMPRAVVDDAPNGGFTLTLERDPSITAVVAEGVARVGDTLQPLGETTATGLLLERLPLARAFTREQQADLVTVVLPEIETRLSVDMRTNRLPRATTTARPRIAFDLSHHGHALSVLPLLVYGEPPVLRIDGDVATALGDDAPVRRRDDERALVRKLRDDLNLVTGRRVDFDGPEAAQFAAKLRGWQQRTAEGPRRDLFAARALLPRIELTGDAFDVSFETDGDEDVTQAPRRASVAAVFSAWRDGLELVPLEGGGWAPLPAGWLEKHGHLVQELLLARDAERRVPTALLPELGTLAEGLGLERPPGLARLKPLLEGFGGIASAPLPADLRAELRPYQRFGVDWLVFLRDAGLGAVLADDMGLGKTLQTICALRGKTLVVCPKSVVYNWLDEIRRFRPGLRTAVYHGLKRELTDDADVTLTTYATLRSDTSELVARHWDIVVLDEAQAIKNADSQTARAAFQLPGGFRVALSGTPVENRLEELWSVMNFANPGLLGKKSAFSERYVAPIAVGAAEAGERLRAKIRPFVLRRMKRDVVPELPPRIDSVLNVELDASERGVYDAVRAATRHELTARLGHGDSVLAALEALLRLRQAACHSGLVPGQNAERSSKIDRLLETLEETVADGHKALVFSQWTSLLDRVEPHLREAGIAFTRLDGATDDRAEVVRTFQDPAGPPVMLVSLKAGGTGLNLTAADHVFLLDPWWNPAVEDQAADRAHRIGQDRPVIVYRMVAKDTVEERILALQTKKRSLSDVALGDANQATAITREELLALLE
ncbi:MAG TPA: DEAD/DEAH box helicase [Polyangiaceae bacterium]|nr:DEAD/DEAH box helicase [Polyangiaceae bacterium]